MVESHAVNGNHVTGATNEKASKKKKRKAAMEEAGEEHSMRKRKASSTPSGGDAEEKRLWSEKDEVAILTGIKLFREEKGSDPFNDLAAFHDFIQDSLSVVVSKRQLGDKARRLKKKFSNNEASLVSPRDLRLFEISKEIWNGGDTNASAGKSEKQAPNEAAGRKSKALVEVLEKQAEKSDKDGIVGKEINQESPAAVQKRGVSDFESSYPNFYAELMDFYAGAGRVDGRTIVKDNLGLAEEKARVLEPELKAFCVWEVKMRAEKIRLLNLVAESGVELIEKVVGQ